MHCWQSVQIDLCTVAVRLSFKRNRLSLYSRDVLKCLPHCSCLRRSCLLLLGFNSVFVSVQRLFPSYQHLCQANANIEGELLAPWLKCKTNDAFSLPKKAGLSHTPLIFFHLILLILHFLNPRTEEGREKAAYKKKATRTYIVVKRETIVQHPDYPTNIIAFLNMACVFF